MTELPKHYDPKAAQERWLKVWEEARLGHSEPDNRKPFTIVIPPPNVTGALHMGHALNNTLQDVLIRWRRMQGYNAEWMPGTDHAGIATQAVVERRVREEEGKTRHDLGRDELVKRIWAWKDQYEKRILGQLRQLGASADWERTRFTLDETCSKAVRETFFKMFRDGYIFRGKRLVNWDTQLQTSVADDETYDETIKGGFWTFKYQVLGEPGASAPGANPEYIRFSTTRPETMLGDVAVAVHPNDPRYQHLIGKFVKQPLVNRDIPIIADGQLVDMELGTGCVKVTPAHDRFDYECGVRHKLPMINILNPDGTINAEGGKYQGLDRYKARDAVVADMEALGLFEGREDRDIPMKFSDRSKTPIEPYLSDQWFVRMGDRDDGKLGLAQLAMDAVTSGRVNFTPERYAKSYLDWLAEKRDWCISRQLWWGHRIPVWSGWASEKETRFIEEDVPEWDDKWKQNVANGDVQFGISDSPNDRWFAWQRSVRTEDGRWFVQRCIAPGRADKERQAESEGLTQDPDVLDTWFSSALWPHSTFGWPEATPEVGYYYPTSVLVTSRDIITLWVARMVLTGLYNLGEVPFHHVYITPKILDGFGETMSKSKGNGVDPLDIIDIYGADALRFYVVSAAGETQDSRLPVANVCPHCGTLVPVKHEHMYLRTKKINCPSCKKAFRPGGPWPDEDKENPTAKQGSERFEQGRNFANKLWNASRFLLMNLEGYTPAAEDVSKLPVEDRWILSRLAATAKAITEQLEAFKFSDVARTLYEFTWSEFCDWYVEMSKGRLKEPASRATAQRVLAAVLDGIVRLAQPVMPFLAESIWEALGTAAPARGLPKPEAAEPLAARAKWPEYPAAWIDADVETRMGRMQELVRAVREIRNRYMVDPKTPVDISVRCSASVAADLKALEAFIKPLAAVGGCEIGPDAQKPAQKASYVHTDFEAFVSLVGLIDPAAESARLTKQVAEKRKYLDSIHKKLASPGFVDRAPAEVVQQQRDLIVETENQIKALEANLADLN